MNYKDRQDLGMTCQPQQSWQWIPRSLFLQRTRRYHKTLSPFWYDWPQQWAPYKLQTAGICHMCADPGQTTSTRTNVKNIAPITSMVIRRINDMCGQVISVRYPNKENHDRQKDETDSNGMMIFAWPPGSGYPNQLEAITPYGSTKAYSQQPTLYTRIFISRWPTWHG